MIEDNPYHAYKHLEASLYLSRDDQAAVQTLFDWGRRRNKDAKNSMEGIKKIKRHEERKTAHIAALEKRVAQLEAALAALESSND